MPFRLLSRCGLAAIVSLAALPALASAQTADVGAGSSTRIFQPGALYGGPRVWIGNLNGATAFGGQVERGLTTPGQVGSGVIAGGVGIDWYSWSHDYGFGSYDYSVVPIQVFGNYHFLLANSPKLDPYAGLSLVYSIVSASWDGVGTSVTGASDSTFDIAGQAGLRYFVSNKFALQGQVGFGYGTIGLGASFLF